MGVIFFKVRSECFFGHAIYVVPCLPVVFEILVNQPVNCSQSSVLDQRLNAVNVPLAEVCIAYAAWVNSKSAA
ncbi:hypothetical protein D3C85_1463570 [compost metagenome]